jgi:hypothetical protein
MKLFAIECRTGCTCCSCDNHYRGPYKTSEDAQRRINYFLSPDSKAFSSCVLGSNGPPHIIRELDAEEIDSNRWIINNRVFNRTSFIEVNENGELLLGQDEGEWYRDSY